MSKPQKRLSKFDRDPKAFENKKPTARSFEILAVVALYRFLPASLAVRLVDGNEDVAHRHLQLLYHKGLVNRFAFPKTGGSNEFNYYVDEPKALTVLIEKGLVLKENVDVEQVRTDKEKAYYKISEGDDSGGRSLFLKHELMISRFHFMLELGCKNSGGSSELLTWKQGSELHSTVSDHETAAVLPHRPDAFFTLRFPNQPEGQNRSNFFYEADRKTTTIAKMISKFRAHFEFIRQKKHQEQYGIRRVRAVLIETLDMKWGEELRQAAMAICPVPLFWFTASEILTAEKPKGKGAAPIFLSRPEIVLQKIWATTAGDLISITE